MKRVDNLNAPSLNGWIIAAGAGVLAFVVAKVVGGFDYTTSGFFAVLVTAVAGLVIGMPWGAADRIPKPEAADEPAHAATHATPATPAPATPAPMAEAAPVMASPVVSAPVSVAPAAASLGIMSPVAEEPKPAKAAAKTASKDEPKAKAAPKAVAAAAPAPAPVGGTKPKALKAARKGVADDLKVIEGIGPALEKVLNENGIFHLDQIAAWGAAEVEWMDGNLKGFKGRVTRDKWVAQAKLIAEVGLEEFLRRAKTNDY